jgi:hypothetical protein
MRLLNSIIASLLALIFGTTAAGSTARNDDPQKTKFTDFLFSLMNEPTRLVAFRENPDAVLDAADLTPEEKETLKSGDAGRILSRLAQAGGTPVVHPPLIVMPTHGQPPPPPDRHPGTPAPTRAPNPSSPPPPTHGPTAKP